MEQYLTHTDYALWEVIVNGDAPAVASASAKGLIPPKTAEQKLARKNELKEKSTLLLVIPDENLLKFHGIKDAKTLWEAIKTRFRGNKESKKTQRTILKQQYENSTASRFEGLDKTYDRFQKLTSQLEIHGEVISQEDVYEGEIKGQSSSSLNSQNVAFVSLENTSSTNEAVNTTYEVAMLTVRVKRFLKKTGRNLNFNGKETISFDKTKVECYNCHRRGHIARECKAPRNQGNRNGDAPRRIVLVETPANVLVVQDGISGYQIGLEALEARIVFHEKNEAVYEEDIAILKYDVQVKDISIKDLKNQLEEGLKEKDDLKLKLEKFEESSKNLTKLINSQISAKDKAGLGYDSQMNKSEVVNSMFNSIESDVDDSLVNDRFKIGKGFHAVPPPYTGNYMPSRPNLSFAGLDDSVYKAKDTDSDNDSVFRPKYDQTKPKLTKINFVKSGENVKSVNKENTHRQVEVAASISTARLVNTAAFKLKVNDALPKTYSYFKAHSPIRRAFNQKSAAKTNNLNEKVKTARINNVTIAGPKAVVSVAVGNGENVVKLAQDQGIFDSGFSRHMTGNKSFLTDYQEVDGGFVAFAGSFKGVIAGNQTNKNAGNKDNGTQQYILLPLLYNSPQSSEDAVADDAGKKHINFLKNKPNVAGSGPDWLFDIDLLTNSMNYEPVTTGNQTNGDAGIETNDNARQARQEKAADHEYILLPFLTYDSSSTQRSDDKDADEVPWKGDEGVNKVSGRDDQERTDSSTQDINTDGPKNAMVNYISKQRRTNHKDYQNCLFACFLSQNEPKKVIQALTDPSWIAAMQDELLQFKLQKVWTLVDLPKSKRAIGTKWVYRNKKDKRGIVVINKARLVAQGYTQEEGIDYDKVFAPVARIEAIRLFLAYASFMGLIVYQMDVKSAFLYGTIEEEVMQRDDGIFISQDKYVADILKKFDFSLVKTASTPIETNKALLKDEEAEDVDVHLYRSMIRSLMYFTASRPNIMDSPFDLEAFSDSDYAGASLDRKSTIGGVMDPKSNT
ncbi:retrovirus-related pol polyprotein from transposon TNT 1-94 [Tanacetum coccineum]